MKLKLDPANGNVVLQDGKPVYVMDDGSEIAFDAARNMESLKNLRTENQQRREKAETLEGQLKAFEGIDATAAKAALETIGKIDQKKLVENGELEKVRAQMKTEYETKLAEANDKFVKLQAQFDGEKIGGEFARSKFIAEKLAIPAGMVQDSFGKHFKLEGGKLIGVHADGEKIYSKANPGEVANFDEALSIIVERYPHKDSILKSDQKGGSGSPAGQGGGQGGGGNKSLTRAQFEGLDAQQRAEHFAKGGAVVDNP